MVYLLETGAVGTPRREAIRQQKPLLLAWLRVNNRPVAVSGRFDESQSLLPPEIVELTMRNVPNDGTTFLYRGAQNIAPLEFPTCSRCKAGATGLRHMAMSFAAHAGWFASRSSLWSLGRSMN